MTGRVALLTAFRNQLYKSRADGGLSLTEDECQIMFDGRPEPRFGASSYGCFYAIHQSVRRKVGEDAHLSQDFTVNVTLSMLVDTPFDRITAKITDDLNNGLYPRVEELIAVVTRNQWQIMNAANTLIGPEYNGFCEAIYYITDDAAQPVDEDWFWAAKNREQNRGRRNWSRMPSDDRMFVGVTSTVRFGGALRIQTIESAG